MLSSPMDRLHSERFAEEKISNFYTTLTGRKQGRNMGNATLGRKALRV
jgi:hypothetical protein